MMSPRCAVRLANKVGASPFREPFDEAAAVWSVINLVRARAERQ